MLSTDTAITSRYFAFHFHIEICMSVAWEDISTRLGSSNRLQGENVIDFENLHHYKHRDIGSVTTGSSHQTSSQFAVARDPFAFPTLPN